MTPISPQILLHSRKFATEEKQIRCEIKPGQRDDTFIAHGDAEPDAQADRCESYGHEQRPDCRGVLPGRHPQATGTRSANDELQP